MLHSDTVTVQTAMAMAKLFVEVEAYIEILIDNEKEERKGDCVVE